MKLCPKCELNYIKDDEELCSVCSEVNKPTKSIHIFGNADLNGEVFDVDLSGYGLYLMKRNYGTYTQNGTESTTMSYVRAVARIIQAEKVSFDSFMQNIDYYVSLYDLDGEKKKEGNIGNGTWRNAVKRVKDFTVYIKNYMGKKYI